MTYPQDIAIVANGVIEDHPKIAARLQQYKKVIAVDGGLHHCKIMQINPYLIIGDFDSFHSKDLHFFPNASVITLQPDKDETDLEVALKEAFKEKPAKATIFAALGKRIDHTLYNLHLLRRYPGKTTIEDEQQSIFAVEKQQIIHCFPGQTLSLIPMDGPVRGIFSKGLKWELHNATFDKNFMSISNVALVEQVAISIAEGDLICCLHHATLL